MTAPRVDRDHLVGCIKELAARYVHKTGRAPRMLITFGGSAMALHGIRATSEDVDLYAPDPKLLSLARDVERETGYTIDLTNKKNLMGDLVIKDIEEDAEVMERVEVLGQEVDIAAISPETLFVIKANTLREKDRDDLFLILPYTSWPKVIARMATLWSQQPSFEAEVMLSNTLSELQMVGERVACLADFEGVPPEIMAQWAPIIERDFPYVTAIQPPPDNDTNSRSGVRL